VQREDRYRQRLRIAKRYLEKSLFAVGCPGCRAANRAAVGHTEEWRKRIMEELAKAGDEGIETETGTFFEHLEEEENKEQKAETEETTWRSSQAAASSSGGGGEVV
jgi:hypothetical protein